LQRTINACADVDTAYSTINSAKTTVDSYTSAIASALQECQALKTTAAGYVTQANVFLSAIGDLITANDSNQISTND